MKHCLISAEQENLKKNFRATMIKTKIFKMVPKTVEKCKKLGKGTERQLLNFLFTIDSKYFIQ